MIAISMAFMSCGDSTPVGSGLLEDEDLKVLYRDDFEIKASTVLTPPTITFTSLNNPISDHYIGELDDPIFGRSMSSFYFQMRYYSTGGLPDYEDAQLDSAVLMLQVNPELTYGDSTAAFDFELYRLRENILLLDTIYSDQVFVTDAVPLSTVNGFRPIDRDTFTITDPIQDSITLSNVVRFRLDDAFGQEIMNTDIPDEGQADALIDQFNGFYLTAISDKSSMMNFDLSSNSINSFLSVYYTINDSVSSRFDYVLGLDRPLLFNHEYAGTPVDEALTDTLGATDNLYIQGMNGVDVEIDLSDLLSLEGELLVNHAELEFTVAQESLADTILYPVLSNIGMYKEASNGNLVEVDDLFTARTIGATSLLFGGVPEKGDNNEITYKINFTSHVKDILRGNESTTVYLSALSKGQNPGRTVILGPNHESHPLTLRITYTVPN